MKFLPRALAPAAEQSDQDELERTASLRRERSGDTAERSSDSSFSPQSVRGPGLAAQLRKQTSNLERPGSISLPKLKSPQTPQSTQGIDEWEDAREDAKAAAAKRALANNIRPTHLFPQLKGELREQIRNATEGLLDESDPDASGDADAGAGTLGHSSSLAVWSSEIAAGVVNTLEDIITAVTLAIVSGQPILLILNQEEGPVDGSSQRLLLDELFSLLARVFDVGFHWRRCQPDCDLMAFQTWTPPVSSPSPQSPSVRTPSSRRSVRIDWSTADKRHHFSSEAGTYEVVDQPTNFNSSIRLEIEDDSHISEDSTMRTKSSGHGFVNVLMVDGIEQVKAPMQALWEESCDSLSQGALFMSSPSKREDSKVMIFIAASQTSLDSVRPGLLDRLVLSLQVPHAVLREQMHKVQYKKTPVFPEEMLKELEGRYWKAFLEASVLQYAQAIVTRCRVYPTMSPLTPRAANALELLARAMACCCSENPPGFQHDYVAPCHIAGAAPAVLAHRFLLQNLDGSDATEIGLGTTNSNAILASYSRRRRTVIDLL